MKSLLAIILMVLFSSSAYSQKLSKEEKADIESKGILEHYQYPINERTKRVSFEGDIKSYVSSDKSYKRVMQFIAYQNWDNTETIKCKNNMPVSVKILDKHITYEDMEEGVITGNGYSLFPLQEYKNFVLTYKFKIKTSEGVCKYQITDFEIMEFVSGPRTKGKASTYTGSTGLGMAASQARFYDIDIRTYTFEDFIVMRGYYERFARDIPYQFKNVTKRIIGDLKESINPKI